VAGPYDAIAADVAGQFGSAKSAVGAAPDYAAIAADVSKDAGPSVMDAYDPTTANPLQRYSAADAMPWYEQFGRGFGMGTGIVGRGIGQRAGELASLIPGSVSTDLGEGATDVPDLSATERNAIVSQMRLEQRKAAAQDQPVLSTVPGMLGAMTPMTLASLLLFRGRGIPGAFGVGAGVGAAQPSQSNAETAGNALLYGLLSGGGQMLTNTVSALAKGPPASDTAQGLVDKFGSILSRGEIAGSERMKRAESFWDMLPFVNFYKNRDVAKQAAVDQMVAGMTTRGPLQQIENMQQPFVHSQQLFDDLGAVRDWAMQQKAGGADLGKLMSKLEPYTGGEQVPNQALESALSLGRAPTDVEKQALRQKLIAQGVPEFSSGTPPTFQVGQTMPMSGPIGEVTNFIGRASDLRSAAKGAGYNTVEGQGYAKMAQAFDNEAARAMDAAGLDPALIAKFRGAYTTEQMLSPAARAAGAPGEEATTYNQAALQRAITAGKNQTKIGNLPPETQQALDQLNDFLTTIQKPRTSKTPEGQVVKGIALGEAIPQIAEVAKSGAIPLMKLGITAGLPYLFHHIMQGTRLGIPGLRAIPDSVSSILGALPPGAASAILPALSVRNQGSQLGEDYSTQVAKALASQ
jgi:hypothetical protein